MVAEVRRTDARVVECMEGRLGEFAYQGRVRRGDGGKWELQCKCKRHWRDLGSFIRPGGKYLRWRCTECHEERRLELEARDRTVADAKKAGTMYDTGDINGPINFNVVKFDAKVKREALPPLPYNMAVSVIGALVRLRRADILMFNEDHGWEMRCGCAAVHMSPLREFSEGLHLFKRASGCRRRCVTRRAGMEEYNVMALSRHELPEELRGAERCKKLEGLRRRGLVDYHILKRGEAGQWVARCGRCEPHGRLRESQQWHPVLEYLRGGFVRRTCKRCHRERHRHRQRDGGGAGVAAMDVDAGGGGGGGVVMPRVPGGLPACVVDALRAQWELGKARCDAEGRWEVWCSGNGRHWRLLTEHVDGARLRMTCARCRGSA